MDWRKRRDSGEHAELTYLVNPVISLLSITEEKAWRIGASGSSVKQSGKRTRDSSKDERHQMLVGLAGHTMMLGWQDVTPSTVAGDGDVGRGVIGVGIDLID